MTCKRLLSLLCALAMLLTIPVVHAEDAADFSAFAKVPDTLYYKGGVVMRGFVKGANAATQPLDLAYAMTSMPYIVLGQPTSWDVIITGGDGDYLCEAILAYQSDLTQSEFDSPWAVPDWFYVEGGSFDYTFTEPGRYFWEFRVMDENGQFFVFQTRIYETYTEANETQETTVAGKVNSIISELITPEMSDYNRALVLHDWLIYNANYDYTYTNYDAAGVLLKGTGVCDSYARAYLMLCTAAGLECMYISGTAYSGGSWGNHGWNMVKLNGSWYHVDCTWDDPGTGGFERHTYFCLDDETMARDHRWNRPDDLFDNGFLPPEAEGGEFEDDSAANPGHYDFTFTTWEEFFEKFDQMVARGERRAKTTGLYTGGLSNSDMYAQMKDYSGEKTQALYDARLITGASRQYSGNLFSYNVSWIEPSSYIRIDETNLRLSIGGESYIFPTEYSPEANVFTWTSSNANIATVSATYDSMLGLVATVKGVSAGTAIITATSQTGSSDSVTVTVLPAYTPDFALTLSEAASGAELDWEAVPGITEYQIVRVVDGVETILTTTTDSSISLTSRQLPADVQQQVYIIGLRKVGGEVVASYKSDPITYGKLTLTFTSSLPDAVLVIEDDAFAGSTSLTSFDIPGKVTTIGARAFANCTSLTAVRIPASVTSIGSGAFSGCPLKYAEVVKGSYADKWLQEHCPDTQLIY